ncbi:molybdopterin-dependent oxidoreductase alpha subunit [Ectopseudomonas oleovorans]|uniref:Molybdopterin-dependent oxidoreductase alpha subunit n=1 Tax=Ectopseudomonas oleovorans TaxID=301 RepID=A0A397MC29_ECTOL|nr:FdhF/YdeP family oxidoreductase [Pseudomonas oleovorans]RIA21488.1 molybdopterin-dependent oxidoreductase alpha subunit [Pseudomonas oleovorans]
MKPRFKPYRGPSGGWGSANAVGTILLRERAPLTGAVTLLKQNRPIDGFACVSCAWAKPHPSKPLAFCENGAKATAWETTSLRCTPEFFAAHALSELRNWSDYQLEQQGRLTHPMRWDATSDRYLPVTWEEAIAEIGAELKRLDAPDQAVFYASGRASLEASYLWQLLARRFGTNNLPDSSNMCHETTSVALPESIGVPVGTVTLNDFAKTDCLLIFGHNTSSNSPRMLHDLEAARQRGAPIITFNPLRERGLERFTNPQSPKQMLTGESLVVSTHYHQVTIGGDAAAIAGICKALLTMDNAAREAGQDRVLDIAFIEQHTQGFEAFEHVIRSYAWSMLERRSGLSRSAMEGAARIYASGQRVIAIYGMGLTQHRHGVTSIQMLVNLLLMRGNLGKEGAGICPVRGHSNVQGQRTVGITEKVTQVPVERLREQFDFAVPEHDGTTTVDACEGVLSGKIKAFLALGGNFVRATPDSHRLEPAWSELRLTVQIATKLNRSALVHGEKAYILPCLGRTEMDTQASGLQYHTTEDSTACIRAWQGVVKPAGSHLHSEPAIIAALAKATLPASPLMDWDAWVADYGLIRDAIATTYPETFHDFNTRMLEPGGFHRPLPATKREWSTDSGKANFTRPETLAINDDVEPTTERRDVLNLMTVRSNDQFNTTVYGYDDRFRGVYGTRSVIFMHCNDMARLGLNEGDQVQVSTAVDDGVQRSVGPLRVTPHDIPEGCCAAYYPECNPLVPLWHHEKKAKVPAAKSIPITLRRVIATA